MQQHRRFNPHRVAIRQRSRFNFDSFLDVLERRVFRIAMLVVLVLWLGEKVWDTATAAHFMTSAHHDIQKTEPPKSAGIGSQ